ncbi:hypothetical protein TTHERM_00476620 (macronuclear) [Tetrahymena thermophila SB210]|uniref:Uncharacterized protein n=1 Tax=Tetrahymena thermophila (strain SB210) TaxID=312017 RepID=I7M842_TETTS|nr:hypothetical protein TTHERM_00476620 [Tetrahymena thermophila SB210]EAR97125.2 hypothetical protein TTHERM_00476620 [Tetrahymena thermophila SB210]|eukprot:XP_001017370.2 hypothetical protein TTHERM_00476620 [Tetrahymena thermophila SB210]
MVIIQLKIFIKKYKIQILSDKLLMYHATSIVNQTIEPYSLNINLQNTKKKMGGIKQQEKFKVRNLCELNLQI